MKASTASGAGHGRPSGATVVGSGDGTEHRHSRGTSMGQRHEFRKTERDLDRLIDPYRVSRGKSFRISDVKPDDSGGFAQKEEAHEVLARGIERLGDLQGRLYAQNRW